MVLKVRGDLKDLFFFEMALIKSYKGKSPCWGKDCYFSENATLVGDVTLGDLLLSIVSPIASVYGDTKDPSAMSRRSYYLFHTTQQ